MPATCPNLPLGGALLGKNAKSRPAIDSQGLFDGSKVDAETGEIRTPERDPASVRCERYALQSVARFLLPKSRTAKCLRLRQRTRQEVEVWRSEAHGSTGFGGLQTCASVWSCPVCAAKISERRRVDLKAALGSWQAQGGVVWLLTLTHPHTARDALAGLLEAETKALHRFFSSRAGVALRDALGSVGHVRAWEVTHGRRREVSNGWHPHFHCLLFLRSDPGDRQAFESQAFEVWAQTCRLAGLAAPSRAHGVSLEDGSEAAAYVAKLGLEDARPAVARWGLDCELTRGHTKRANDGETPFDLLRAVLGDRDSEAGRLFSEFAAAFHGRRQLVWSRGLRELLGLDAEATDAEIEAVEEEGAEVLGTLSPDQWRAVLAADVRAEVLELARHGWEAVARLLVSLDRTSICQKTR